MAHHPVDEEKNRNQTLGWLLPWTLLMENKLSNSSWSGIDCARAFVRWSEICDDFQIKRKSDVVFLFCAARDPHFFIYGAEIGPQS